MTRLVLFPGLGADERMFQAVGATGFSVELATLPDPEAGMTLADYAAGIIHTLSIHPEDWVGGCSFGSMVATEIARQTPVAAVVLLAGATDSSAVPVGARLLGGLLQWLPVRWIRSVSATNLFMNASFNHPGPEILQVLKQMLLDTSDSLLKEGLRLARTSRNPRLPSCPIHAIHGGRDRVLKIPTIPGVRVIPDAGHALVGSHGEKVTAFLAELNQQYVDA